MRVNAKMAIAILFLITLTIVSIQLWTTQNTNKPEETQTINIKYLNDGEFAYFFWSSISSNHKKLVNTILLLEGQGYELYATWGTDYARFLYRLKSDS